LPLVVDRDLRVEYIGALEGADVGSLAELATIFARLERAAILQALSVDADADIARQQSLTSAVIGSLVDKFSRRRERKLAELRHANDVATALRERAETSVAASLNELTKTVTELDASEVFVRPGGADHDNAHWYKYEVVQTAREAGKFANFSENHYFIKGSIRGRERLVFVVSFHHVGRDLTGIMEATAFSKLESYENSDDRESATESFFPCSVEPFVFTHQTKPQDIASGFDRWLDAALAVGLKEFADRL